MDHRTRIHYLQVKGQQHNLLLDDLIDQLGTEASVDHGTWEFNDEDKVLVALSNMYEYKFEI